MPVTTVLDDVTATNDHVADIGRRRGIQDTLRPGASRARTVQPHGDEVGQVTRRDEATVLPAEGAVAEEAPHREEVARAEAAAFETVEPLVHLHPAHLLEGVDHRVLVGAEADRDACVVQVAGRADAVSEIPLGGRAEAGRCASISEKANVFLGEMSSVHDRGGGREEVLAGEQLGG